MTGKHDEAMETLLRQQFEGPVADAGFSERVVARLPPRPRRARWPLWVSAAAGVAACWAALLPSSLLRIGAQDWFLGRWSPPSLTLLVVVLGMTGLAAAWGTLAANEP